MPIPARYCIFFAYRRRANSKACGRIPWAIERGILECVAGKISQQTGFCTFKSLTLFGRRGKQHVDPRGRVSSGDDTKEERGEKEIKGGGGGGVRGGRGGESLAQARLGGGGRGGGGGGGGGPARERSQDEGMTGGNAGWGRGESALGGGGGVLGEGATVGTVEQHLGKGGGGGGGRAAIRGICSVRMMEGRGIFGSARRFVAGAVRWTGSYHQVRGRGWKQAVRIGRNIWSGPSTTSGATIYCDAERPGRASPTSKGRAITGARGCFWGCENSRGEQLFRGWCLLGFFGWESGGGVCVVRALLCGLFVLSRAGREIKSRRPRKAPPRGGGPAE